MDRQACVIAIGGGAMLDTVGYAAALVHRGVRLVRLPTTVLAQNDAGVGVKNGINAFGAKNFLGTFAPPYAVINDSKWLDTLPQRDIRAGLAEAVKVAAIRDPAFFDWLEVNAAGLSQCGPLLDESIRRAALLHLEHIRSGGDPFERGSARPLDYGHWAAHKLETLSGHELRHGEAVAIGMALDASYAHRAGLLDQRSHDRLLGVIAGLGLPLYHPALDEIDAGRRRILAGLEEFREHLGGALSVTLLRSIGDAVEVHAMEPQHIEAAIDSLRERAGA
jgi:3-dehydroquinate synthase